jgi:hypothetical protein
MQNSLLPICFISKQVFSSYIIGCLATTRSTGYIHYISSRFACSSGGCWNAPHRTISSMMTQNLKKGGETYGIILTCTQILVLLERWRHQLHWNRPDNRYHHTQYLKYSIVYCCFGILIKIHRIQLRKFCHELILVQFHKTLENSFPNLWLHIFSNIAQKTIFFTECIKRSPSVNVYIYSLTDL